VIAGQYLAFTAILAVAIAITFGARFLPKEALPYLGLLPIALGVRDAWKAWQNRKLGDHGEQAESGQGGPAIIKVATTTFANGGDNIGVYVPVFTNVGTGGTIVYCVVFLVLVGVWCAAGRFVATRPVIAKPLGRWGHILLPVVLITIGLLILIEGGAFGL
jgi:cadmium resistance protein CadD (predicted permease)